MATKRWAFNERFIIGTQENPMLERWRLFSTPWFGLYVHFIYREDLDRHMHDHPWRFWSLVLKGSYIELLNKRPGDVLSSDAKIHRRFSLHGFPLHWAHKITLVEPGTVTLVLVGPKVRQWGFYVDDKWMPWHQYNSTVSKAWGSNR